MATTAPRTSGPAKAPPASGSAPAPGASTGRRRGPTPAPAAAPAGPAVKLGAGPAARDSRFKKVIDKLQGSAAKTKQHVPAAQKAQEAQAAAVPPPHEKLAGAQSRQVDLMNSADTKTPQPDSFLTMLRVEIQKVMPKTVSEGDDYMKGNDRQQLKGAMTGNINQQKEQATAGIKGASGQKPDETKIQGKEVTPLAAETPPPSPPAIGAADAMPAPKPEAEVSLQQGKQEADQKLADANVTPTQLQKANDPRFSAVLDAKGAVYKQADAGPQKYRADEQKVLTQAGTLAVAGERVGLAGFRGAKGKAGSGVRARQLTAKERDEARRKEVTDHIEGIYKRTKESVDKKLATLETDVGTMFDQGADAAIATMKAYVEDRFDDRYSGISGKALWVKDKFLPLPAKVKAWFTEAHKVFEDELDKLVVRIAALVEQRLKGAKDEITAAQNEIKTYVNGLDPDLKQLGQEAEKKVNEQFNELRQAVDDKKNDLAQSLAQKYKDAYDKGEAALKELKDAHKSLIEKLVDKIKEVVEILRNFKNRILSMLSEARDAIDLIIADPIGFLSNLLDAIKQGVRQFANNIWTHLKAGFMKWLFGSLADAGIAIPTDFSLGSILKLVLQVLGLTYDRIRAKAVKIIGERNVMLLEKAWEFIHTLITGGPAALWEQIKEFLGDLKSMLLDAIQDWVVTSVIKAAITKLVSMFNPVGAIIQAIITIYNTVMFFIENINRILDFVEAIIHSVLKIARGDIASAANWIEQALANTIPIIIGFLARLLGLSGVTDKIVGFIKKIQSTVDKAIDKVIEKVVGGIKGFFAGGRKSEKSTDQETPGSADVKEKVKAELSNKTITNPQEADTLLKSIYSKYKSQGLKGIKLAPDPTDPDLIDVIVSASIAKIIAMRRRDPALKKIAASLVPYSKKTSLYVFYDGNKPFPPNGKPFQNRVLHAEQIFLNRVPELLELIQDRRSRGQISTPVDTPVPVTLDINRSPCDGCAPLLASASSQYGRDIRLKLNIASVYKASWDSIELTSKESFIKMHDAGIELNALKVWAELKKKLQDQGVQEIFYNGRYHDLNEVTGSFMAEELRLEEIVESIKHRVQPSKIPVEGSV